MRIINRGFTLIELAIVIAIIFLIATLGLISLNRARTLHALAISGQDILSVLQLAQSKTLAGEENSQWGVHIESSQIVLFRGASFPGAPLTDAYILPSSLEIANIIIAGGLTDIVFKKITGATDQSGTFDLRVKNSPSDMFSITIDSSGKAARTASAPLLLGTRAYDLRHRVFALTWSIKTATTLTLRFSDPPNPDTIQNISMSPFFDAGVTKFDWSGTYAIAESPQTIRIHTTALSDTNTSLSVDRDCRLNNKKIKITIDAKDIATYEADCRTITVEAFGGTMSEL